MAYSETRIAELEAEVHELARDLEQMRRERNELWRQATAAEAALAKAREALTQLSKEVSGLAAYEPWVRRLIGNTYWAALMLRADDARAALQPEEKP